MRTPALAVHSCDALNGGCFGNFWGCFFHRFVLFFLVVSQCCFYGIVHCYPFPLVFPLCSSCFSFPIVAPLCSPFFCDLLSPFHLVFSLVSHRLICFPIGFPPRFSLCLFPGFLLIVHCFRLLLAWTNMPCVSGGRDAWRCSTTCRAVVSS